MKNVKHKKLYYEKETQAHLVYLCEARRLPHTGDRDTLIVRLAASDEVADAEPEVEPGTEE